MLDDVGMIAGDTSRSRAYLQALARNSLLPAHVLVLGQAYAGILPGQVDEARKDPHSILPVEPDECWSEAHFDPTLSIVSQLGALGISHECFSTKDINDPVVVDAVRRRPETTLIYSGFGGALLRSEVLATGKHFLHVHGGYLPDYKGSTTNYFSVLAENSLGASALFLNKEIDGGPVLLRRTFPRPSHPEAIDHVYDSGARAKVLVDTLKRHVVSGHWEFELPQNAGGETYYVIHPVLKHIAILAQPER